MPRALGSELTSNVEALVTRPRYLIELGATPLRHATGGAADGSVISWDSNSYAKTDVRVSALRWERGSVQGFTLTYLVAPDLLSTFTGIDSDSSVKLYLTAALDTYANADVVELFDGSINGGWSLTDHVLTYNVVRTSSYSPPRRARPEDGFSKLTLPGRYNVADRVFILERGR